MADVLADAGPLMPVEVAYARPDEQVLRALNVPEGTTVEQAIRQSGLLERFPEIDLSVNKVGVFAKVVPLGRALAPRDRVEIYRSLIADPKAVRRQRAEAGRATSSSEG
ncbi:MAG: RnfH family protein [Halothiobacillaceae bacterium]|jgi:putative ubiquitin-RnfH superfamily antitoxin RatB of RatAB toxin-antitoxin module|nr:RnfH family protein [Halothiobacillaceae bacterium]MDY0049270.1 RnfH family protein [Halothiobacillaceae bacterium]